MEPLEEKTCHPVTADNDPSGIAQSTRYLQPAHYTFQIKNFSLLLRLKEEKFNSGEFEVGGYRWILVLYPNGKMISKKNGHISLYLAIAYTSDLPVGWEVHTNIRFFVFDQIRDKYLIIQDADGRVSRYHNLKTEWGFAQLLSHETFNDSSNGYLLNDTCVFGVEVFIIKGSGKGECLSMIKQPQKKYFTWRMTNYKALKDEWNYSELFTVQGLKWKLELDQKGGEIEGEKYLSLYLILASEILPPSRKLYAEFKLRIKNQIHTNHLEKEENCWFSKGVWCGYDEFLALRDLEDMSKGYLVNDTLLIECKIDVISTVDDLSKKK